MNDIINKFASLVLAEWTSRSTINSILNAFKYITFYCKRGDKFNICASLRSYLQVNTISPLSKLTILSSLNHWSVTSVNRVIDDWLSLSPECSQEYICDNKITKKQAILLLQVLLKKYYECHSSMHFVQYLTNSVKLIHVRNFLKVFPTTTPAERRKLVTLFINELKNSRAVEPISPSVHLQQESTTIY